MNSQSSNFHARFSVTGGRLAGCALVGSLLVSALLMAFAIGSARFAWVGWVTLPPLFLAIRILSPLRAFAAGGLWGASLFAFALLLGVPSVPVTFSACLLLSLTPAVYSGVGALVTRGTGWGVLSAVSLGVGWIGVEFALKPLALPNGLLAGTQSFGTLVSLGGGLFGYAFVAFLIAFVNGLLLSVVGQVCLRMGGAAATAGGRPPGKSLWNLILSTSPLLIVHSFSRPRAPPIG